jgi:putative transposase
LQLTEFALFKFTEIGKMDFFDSLPDHIHLVMIIPPKYSVSSIMGYVKGKIAIRLFQRYEKIGKRYWGRHLWARGYCVSTVGLNEEQIRKYVKWQDKKEREIEKRQLTLF